MRIKQPLRVAVFQGAPWLGPGSAKIAQFLVAEASQRTGAEVELLDIRDWALVSERSEPCRDFRVARRIQQIDALILLTAEQGWCYPALLRDALGALLKKRVPRAVGFCGLSSSTFAGSQTLPELLPLVRERSLVTVTQDLHFENIHSRYGQVEGQEFPPPLGEMNLFFDELLWMAAALRDRRDAQSRRAFSLFVRPPRPRPKLVLHEVGA